MTSEDTVIDAAPAEPPDVDRALLDLQRATTRADALAQITDWAASDLAVDDHAGRGRLVVLVEIVAEHVTEVVRALDVVIAAVELGPRVGGAAAEAT